MSAVLLSFPNGETTMNKLLPSLYIETTIPSYATARDSRDVVRLVRQIVTRAFWEDKRHSFRLFVSQAVVNECGRGDPEAAQRRLEFINGIESYPVTAEILRLAEIYQKLLNIPAQARVDCIHLATCVTRHIDYLLTWNCTHLGPIAQKKIRDYNEKYGLWTPLLVTPDTIAEVLRED
jgi:predicted nucleic acid-binding protein